MPITKVAIHTKQNLKVISAIDVLKIIANYINTYLVVALSKILSQLKNVGFISLVSAFPKR